MMTGNRTLRRLAGAAISAGALLLVSACSGMNSTGSSESCSGESASGVAATKNFPSRTLRIIAPAAPGGGWDQTSRTAQQAMEKSGLVRRNVEVINVPGAGGTVGLARLV